jgi:ATP-dependent Clp protease ATP-binding subunit ClpA
MNMFERFTRSARAAVVLAQEDAGELNAQEIGPEHLLVGALHSAGHDLSAVLGGYGLTAEVIRAQLVVGDGNDSFEADAKARECITSLLDEAA